MGFLDDGVGGIVDGSGSHGRTQEHKEGQTTKKRKTQKGNRENYWSTDTILQKQ